MCFSLVTSALCKPFPRHTKDYQEKLDVIPVLKELYSLGGQTRCTKRTIKMVPNFLACLPLRGASNLLPLESERALVTHLAKNVKKAITLFY